MIIGVTITDNREGEIADALRSVAAHVDQLLLIDTGVTDRTVKIAKEVARLFEKRLTVVKHTWADFATARNFALDAACLRSAEWALFIDTDERLDLGAVDLRDALERVPVDVDVLFVESDDGYYPKQRLVRPGAIARFVGPVHETLIGGTREVLRGVTFRELPKTDAQIERKCTRDAAILRAHIEKFPADPRWRLYLGMSLEGLGQHVQAAEAYARCAELRGQEGDEAAWSSFKQAEQLAFLGRHEEALAAAVRGLSANATFGECAWIAAEAASALGRKDQAVAWARMSIAIGMFKGDAPERLGFRHLPGLYEGPYNVLNTTLPDEAGRNQAALDFQTAKATRVRAVQRIGERDLDWLSVSKAAPTYNREEARTMLHPPELARLCPSARATTIQFDPPGGRLPMNPSICWHKGALWCVVRTVNYTLNGRKYTIHDPEGITRTENYLGRLDGCDRLVRPTLMRDLDTSPRVPSQVVGYEDVRLASIKSKLVASATVCDRAPAGQRRIARLYLDDAGNVLHAAVQSSNQPHEKNWMPFALDGALTWIYSLDPTAILPGPLHACPFALEHLRGGAVAPFRGGYLCVMHEVIDTTEGRLYLHRFVRLDKTFRVFAVSPAWVFESYGIEFCAGLVVRAGRATLSFGVADKEAKIMRVSAKEIENMRWITP